MEPRTKNFSPEELRCKCEYCKGEVPNECDQDALDALQMVRDDYGKPMTLNSAYRCARHPDEVSKKKGPGTHNEGIAFDIDVPWGRDRGQLIELFLKHGFRGLGFANGFLHADYRDQEELSTWGY